MACITGRPCYDNIPCQEVPCETREFDCFRDKMECYKECNKGQKMPFINLFNEIEITPEIEQAIINRLDRMSNPKLLKR